MVELYKDYTADGYRLTTPYQTPEKPYYFSSKEATSLINAANSDKVNGKWKGDTRGDILFNTDELIRFFKELGVTITKAEAVVLIRIYGRGEGDGNIINKNFVLNDMVTSGFLVPTVNGDTVQWVRVWQNVQEPIARAIERLGLGESGPTVAADGTTGLTAEQYETGVDRLFGDFDPVDRGKANEVVRVYGSNGVISTQQIMETIDVKPGDGRYDSAPIKLYEPDGRDFWPLRYEAITLPPADIAVDPVSGLTRQQTHMVKYLMNFAGEDGKLSREEFEKGVKSLLGHGVKLEDHMVDFFMQVYASKETDGAFMHQRDVAEMVGDTTLGASPLTELEGDTRQGFNINGNIVKLTKMMVRYVPGNDTPKELQSLFRAMGLGDLGIEQMRFLVKIYGDPDGRINEAGFKLMLSDGLFVDKAGNKLTADSYLADVGGVNWKSIPPNRIADALFREVNLVPGKDRMTAVQFQQALKGLFNYEADAKTIVIPTEFGGSGVKETKPSSGTLPVDDKDASFLVRYASEFVADPETGAIDRNGQPGTTVDTVGLTKIFEEGLIQINMDGATKWIPITDHHVDALKTPVDVVEFLKTFDADGDQMLNEKEWKAARDALPTAGLDDKNRKFDRLMHIYGGKEKKIEFVALEVMGTVGVLSVGKNGQASVNLDKISEDVLISALFWSHGKDPAKDTLNAGEFEKAVKYVFGDWEAISGGGGKLVGHFGTGEGKNKVVNFDQIQDMFLEALRIDGPGRKSIIRIKYNPKKLTYAEKDPSRWRSILSVIPAAALPFAESLAAAASLPVTVVVGILTGASWAIKNPEQVKKVKNALYSLIKGGGEEILGLVETLVGALMNDPRLSEEAKKYLKAAEADLNDGASEAVATFFMELLSVDEDQATALVEKAAGLKSFADLDMAKILKDAGINNDTMTQALDDMVANISVIDPTTGKEAEGARRRLLGFETLKNMVATNGQKSFQVGIEHQIIKSVTGMKGAMDVYQVRAFVSNFQLDSKTGKVKSFDVKLRLLEATGTDGPWTRKQGPDGRDLPLPGKINWLSNLISSSPIGLDYGVVSTHDVVFTVDFDKKGDPGLKKVKINTFVGGVAEWTAAFKGLFEKYLSYTNTSDPSMFSPTALDQELQWLSSAMGVDLNQFNNPLRFMHSTSVTARAERWAASQGIGPNHPHRAANMLFYKLISSLVEAAPPVAKEGLRAAGMLLMKTLQAASAAVGTALRKSDFEAGFVLGVSNSVTVYDRDNNNPKYNPKAGPGAGAAFLGASAVAALFSHTVLAESGANTVEGSKNAHRLAQWMEGGVESMTASVIRWLGGSAQTGFAGGVWGAWRETPETWQKSKPLDLLLGFLGKISPMGPTPGYGDDTPQPDGNESGVGVWGGKTRLRFQFDYDIPMATTSDPFASIDTPAPSPTTKPSPTPKPPPRKVAAGG